MASLRLAAKRHVSRVEAEEIAATLDGHGPELIVDLADGRTA
jgi:hypothetical protein